MRRRSSTPHLFRYRLFHVAPTARVQHFETLDVALGEGRASRTKHPPPQLDGSFDVVSVVARDKSEMCLVSVRGFKDLMKT